ncbi:unnamed protein product [Oikopleura dioica]|uniref:C2 domain-containing protein n=1 Tax=Oikopleura dioica TaxID=34765 RepID=E4YLP1_OIKDI|nr:unnamed protein product [Oikopleura dioica]
MYSRRSRPSREILLSLSANHLHDKDLFSKSDPYAVVYKEENGSAEEIGRTETMKDNLNPNWTRKIKISENLKMIKIAVFDQDSSSKKTSNDDYLGEVIIELQVLLSSSLLRETSHSLSKNKSTISKSKLQIFAYPCTPENPARYRFDFQGINLVNKDTFSKSDPFFEIRFLAPNSTTEITVYRSEVLDDNLSPNWAPFIIHKDQLCAGDDRKKVKIVVFDFDGPENFELIGEAEVQVNCLHDGLILPLLELKKLKKKTYRGSGLLKIKEATKLAVSQEENAH